MSPATTFAQHNLHFPTALGGLGLHALGFEEADALSEAVSALQMFRHFPDGPVSAFETECAAYVGAKHALLVNSGTSALICALMALGVGPGDEVLVPGYTYVADASAVTAVGAVPVLCDIDETLGLCPEDAAVRITPWTKAMIAVHMQGVPCRMRKLRELCSRCGIALIEDASQCVGGAYFGRRTGSLGDLGIWSLNAFKNITVGEGGVLFTDDTALYHRACYAADPAEPTWRKHQIAEEQWEESLFAGNCYRANPLSAALGMVQLKKLDALIAAAHSRKQQLLNGLEPCEHYTVQCIEDPSGDCGISAALIFRDTYTAQTVRDLLLSRGVPVGALGDEGFPPRHVYTGWTSVLQRAAHHPLASPWLSPHYKGDRNPTFNLSRTDEILARSLRLSLHAKLTEHHIAAITSAINTAVKSL
jgi:dTDP-4-amino-4,6-dideoxygalactose transaminase